jgi:diaminopimelate decarboxylase
VQALREIARRHGTPTYAYDVARLREQVARLHAHLPPAVDVLYSLKANASLGLCSFLARCGLGADVASAGELVTGLEAGFPAERIFLSGPDRSPPVLALLRTIPQAIISADSVSELRRLAAEGLPHRIVLRLRPDYGSFATCAAASDSRFGFLLEDLSACRDVLAASPLRMVGFHVFSGSQVLPAEGIVHHLRGASKLCERAAEVLDVTPGLINLGGGFGIPYAAGEQELDLALIGAELRALLERSAPARLVLELGRYLVAQAGWYLTTVLAEQTHRGRRAVVVDGGSHQRADLCGLGLRTRALPPVLLEGRTSPLVPTDVLGCLSLPGDVLAEGKLLPALLPGDVLAFPNAGAYGLAASPNLFHGHPLPAEVAFEGARVEAIRERQPVRGLLEGQAVLRW